MIDRNILNVISGKKIKYLINATTTALFHATFERPSEFSRRDKMWSASLPRIQITTLYSTNTTIFCPKIDRPGSQDFPHLDN